MENWSDASQLAQDIFELSPFKGKFSLEDKATYLQNVSTIEWKRLSREKRKQAATNKKTVH